MNPITFKSKFAAACLATAIAGAGITIARNAHGAPARDDAAQVERTEARAVRSSVDDDASRYAELEKAAEQQKAYQGGQMIVIGITTTAAIILLVLALLLI
jgi:CHASE3 domain sensor protein